MVCNSLVEVLFHHKTASFRVEESIRVAIKINNSDRFLIDVDQSSSYRLDDIVDGFLTVTMKPPLLLKISLSGLGNLWKIL